jgi:hypothetical protein
MANTQGRITDSWKAYQECLSAIQRFLTEIRIQDSEAWVGDVCFGSQDQPLVRAPLRRDSAKLVGEAIERAETVTANLRKSIRTAVETSRRVLEELKADGAVERTDLQRVIGRIESLEQLLEELVRGAADGDMTCYPAQLIRWSEVLSRSLVRGDPAVSVRVVMTYVL